MKKTLRMTTPGAPRSSVTVSLAAGPVRLVRDGDGAPVTQALHMTARDAASLSGHPRVVVGDLPKEEPAAPEPPKEEPAAPGRRRKTRKDVDA